MRQRYDDFADWYDAYATGGTGLPFALAADRLLARLLGASAVAVADRATTRMLAGQDARHPTGRGTRNAASCQANVP